MAFLILHCLEIRRLSFLSSFLLLLLLLALFSFFAPCNTHEEEESSRSSISLQQYRREFDYFVLALQWPATLCQGTRHCCSSNACCRRSNAPTGFTIHGLWADYIDGTWPACCSNDRFDIKEVKPLLEGLQKYWPSLRCGSTATCHGRRGLFWAHEWEKHGTCATSVLRDEYSYFLTTLNLYLKYNITEILNEAGYPPSNTEKYPLGGVISAIENAIRATPLVVCSHGAVSEIRICFYKNFKPLDCTYRSSSNDNVVASSSCPRYISLPEYVPIGLGNNASIPWLPSTEVM